MKQPRDYATIPLGIENPDHGFSVSKAGAIVVGLAAGLSALLLCVPVTQSLFSTTVTSRPVAVIAQSQVSSVGKVGIRVPSHPLPAQGMATSEDVGAQPTSAFTSAAAFIAGCTFAVAGLAMQLRPRPKSSSIVAPEFSDPFAMFATSGTAIGGTKDLHVVPPVIGQDPDPNSIRRRMEAMLRKGQDKICAAIEKSDGKAKFRADAWMREDGGGGLTRVLADGAVWEKAGIALSVVWGAMPQPALAAATDRAAEYLKKLGLKPGERVPFFACGLSCVMHPRNPHCPTMHFNYRIFEINANGQNIWWFAGGTDITPAYLVEEDMKHFHGTYKAVCDKYDPYFYDEFKKWADEYFLIKHRGETRGLGGIFFDDLNDRDQETLFRFAEECLDTVVPAYVPIVDKHKNDPFTDEQKRWQLMRRGRYVEFNVIYDRGTIFGLKAGGRVESILMTLPENACWEYNHHPAPGSEEEKIMKCFQHPRSWV